MKYVIVLLLAAIFIAGCSKEPDVVEMKSGLKYTDDSLGTGNKVEPGDIITVHYSAWIIKDSSDLYSDWFKDSTRASMNIGSSRAFNQPFKYKLGAGQFIRGTDEGIAGMKVGGKRTLIIPSSLAYGPTGFGPVPPNASLKVVVEMMDAKKPPVADMWKVDTTKAVTTASGLKYIIVQQGSGPKPVTGDIVAVHYSGYFTNGKKFDSSVERDEPFVFTVGKGMVIKGWDEGIRLLNKGAKARLIVPADLAYGSMARDPIPPNSTLVFDIELLDIKGAGSDNNMK